MSPAAATRSNKTFMLVLKSIIRNKWGVWIQWNGLVDWNIGLE